MKKTQILKNIKEHINVQHSVEIVTNLVELLLTIALHKKFTFSCLGWVTNGDFEKKIEKLDQESGATEQEIIELGRSITVLYHSISEQTLKFREMNEETNPEEEELVQLIFQFFFPKIFFLIFLSRISI